MVLEHLQTHPLWDSPLGQQLEWHQWHMERGRSDCKCGELRVNCQKPGISTVSSLSPPHTATKWWSRCLTLAITYGSTPHNLLVPFLQQVMLLRQGVKAALLITQKQIQGGCQMEKTKKYGPNERTEQNTRKEDKQNGDSQPIRCRINNTGYQDAQRISWVWQKKIKEEMKKWRKEENKWNKE